MFSLNRFSNCNVQYIRIYTNFGGNIRIRILVNKRNWQQSNYPIGDAHIGGDNFNTL